MGKAQEVLYRFGFISVRYEGRKPVEVTDVVVSTQHVPGTPQEEIRAFVEGKLLPASLDAW